MNFNKLFILEAIWFWNFLFSKSKRFQACRTRIVGKAIRRRYIIFFGMFISLSSMQLFSQNEVELRPDGIVVPRLNSVSILSPAMGQVIYDTNASQLMYYDGSVWKVISPWAISGNDINYNDGNLGLGDSSPDKILSIRDENHQIQIIDSSNDKKWSITTVNNQGIGFYEDSATPRMTLYAGGNLGIGTTSPDAKLEVAGQVKITGGVPGDGKVLTSDSEGLASWENTGLTLPFTGGAPVVSGYAFSIINSLYTGIRGTGGVLGILGVGPTGIFGSGQSASGYGGNFENTEVGGAGLQAKAGDGDSPDIILAGNSASGTGDNGRIHSDPDYTSSDIILVSNDEVAVHLDEDGDGEDADFVIKDKDDNDLFSVDESGTISWKANTSCISIDCSGFNPKEEDYEYSISTEGLHPQGGLSGTEEQDWFAAVSIPQGCRITGLTAFFRDDSEDDDLRVQLLRRQYNASTSVLLGEVTTSGDDGRSSLSDSVNHVVDNSFNSYYLLLRFFEQSTPLGSLLTLKGVKISYEITGPG